MFERWRLGAGRLLAAVSVACLPVPAACQDAPAAPTAEASPTIPTSAFAARSPFNGMPELSPDGRRIAYGTVEDGKGFIGVVEIDGATLERKIALEDSNDLQWYDWAGNDRLVMTVSRRIPLPAFQIEIRFNRTMTIEVATGEVRQLGDALDTLVYVDPAGAYVLVGRPSGKGMDQDVWRISLDDRAREPEIVASQRGVLRWVADEAGLTRIGLGIDGRKLKVWYRTTAEEPFRLIAKLGEEDEDELWDVVRLISGSDEGLVLEPGPSGRTALRRFNYATREVGEVVYENPDWDLDDFELDEQGHPAAVHFTDDAERVVWLDPAMARLQATLERTLGAGRVRIADRSRDGSRVLVAGGGADDPGAWYVYTPASRALQEFSRLRPEIDPAALAPVKPVEYTARDGAKIRAYLTLPRGREAKALPLIVLPHGGPYGVRDTLDYSDEVQLLANRGYAVLQPNFRGSRGFGEAFEDLGKGEIGRRMQDDLDDAVDWAAAQGLVDPARVCLVGASYGGYAALWGVIRNPERYRCAASFAGVTEWDKQLQYDNHFFDRDSRRAWRETIRGEDRKFDLDSVSPARQAARIARPVLLVHGKLDNNVPFAQFEAMRKAMTRARVAGAEFLVLDKAGHGFATAEEEQAWYDALVGFLARNNPSD